MGDAGGAAPCACPLGQTPLEEGHADGHCHCVDDIAAPDAGLQDAGLHDAGRPDEATLRALLALPDQMELPAISDFNPLTTEKIELGRHLFYEKRLSGNGTQACASCHLQSMAFADDKRTPSGSTGQVLVRNSPGLANVAYPSTLTWANNGLLTLEQQIKVPLLGDNPIELGLTDPVRDEVLRRFADDEDYVRMFAAAFPDDFDVDEPVPTLNMVVFALASFCRTLISGSSPYDQYLAGDRNALTEQQKRGVALFNGERLECFHCHTGVNLTTSYHDANTPADAITYPFFNNGLYNVGNDGSYPSQDQGLYNVTLKPNHRGLFRPQSLRNVALTAPYMHDGSIATLEDVVRHYAAGGRVIEDGPNAGDGRRNPQKSGLVRGFAITDGEIADVVAFFDALTDPKFLTDPALSNPVEE